MAYAILLCAVASLSTGAGGIIVALWPKMSCRTLAVFQGFAAGVMIGISFLNMLIACKYPFKFFFKGLFGKRCR